MLKKIKARFSHGVFTPLEKVEFPENEELEITIEEKASVKNAKEKDEIDFATWPLGAKGKLTRGEIYDYL
ncbi:MAG: antitoxin family protein [Candidatus Brocadiaceae bacterium]|nr:antitoxin family protein [Candidatus Brocadiaceae bacterium]